MKLYSGIITGSLTVNGALTVNGSSNMSSSQAVSASYSSTSSVAYSGTGSFTGSFIGVITGSLFGTASQATSASYSYTASSAILASASLIATSASYAYTASSAISASYSYTASSAINSSASLIAVSASYALTASVAYSGTGSFTGSFVGVHTGSLFGTASNALSSSYSATASFSNNFMASTAVVTGTLNSTYNTATGIANNAFNNAKTILGNIHIQNGAGTSGNNYQAAITFQGGTSTEAQAGIYVSNNNSTGTAMGFATTDSYTTGPQLFMTVTNTGLVNFPRAVPTYAGTSLVYNSGTWGISISGNAATATTATTTTGNAGSVTYLKGRTDTAAYPILWGADYTNTIGTIAYSCAAVTIQSSTGTVNATTFVGAFTGTATNATTAGGFTPSQTGGAANRIVVADSNGYIQNNYFYTSGGGSERNSSGLSYVAGFNSSDYYIRSYNSTAVASLVQGAASGTWGISISGNAATATNVAWNGLTNASVNGWMVSSAKNTYGSINPTFYLSHSGGYGMHINSNNNTSGIYILQLYNSSGEVFGAYSDGTVKANGSALITAGNIGSQSVSYASSAGSITNFTAATSNNPIDASNPPTLDAVGYVNANTSLFGQTDGGLYSSAYSTAWYHQIYGDFRTGQIAVRGKNSGTWQAWRTVLDSGNFSSYATPIRTQSNWNDSTVINNVVGMLAWKNYGNPHVIFDASQGTSPSGGGVSQTNATYGWTASYPTLMGWNGSGTYGVRVDSARVADSATSAGTITSQANSATITATSANTANQIVQRDGSGDIAIGTLNANYAYFGSGGRGITSPDAYPSSYGNLMTYGTGRSGWYGYGIHDGSYDNWYMSNGAGFGIYGSRNGQWAIFYDYSTNSVGINTSTGVSGYSMAVPYDIYCRSITQYSDARAKENVQTVVNALDKVKLMRGVKYNFIDNGDNDDKNTGIHLGVIAQEVQQIEPDLVNYHAATKTKGNDGKIKEVNDKYTVEYQGFNALFIEAFKEQQTQIDNLTTKLNQLLNK